MSPTAAWRWCLVAGLGVIACSIGFGHIPGLHQCGDARGLGPVIGFELSATPVQVARLFGVEPCRSALIAGQRTGLWLDALGFIPSYTAFLCLAGWATGARWRRWIVAAVLLAGLGDEIEGPLLAAILRDLPGTPTLLLALWWETHVKFAALVAGTFGVSVALMIRGHQRRLRTWFVAIPIGSQALIAGFRLATNRPGEMLEHFTFAWGWLLLVAAIGAAWPRLLASPLPAPAQPSA